MPTNQRILDMSKKISYVMSDEALENRRASARRISREKNHVFKHLRKNDPEYFEKLMAHMDESEEQIDALSISEEEAS